MDAIKEIAATIEQFGEIASTIAAAAKEQGIATQEIPRDIQRTAKG